MLDGSNQDMASHRPPRQHKLSTYSSFSTNYRTLGSMQSPNHQPGLHAVTQPPARLASSMAGIYAGPGGLGSWISVFLSMSMQGSWGSRVAGDRGSDGHRGHPEQEVDYAMPEWPPGLLSGKDEDPEVDNWRLESKIQEHLVRDYLGCVGLDLCNLCGHCPHFSADWQCQSCC